MDKGLAEIDIRIVSESDFTELMKEHEHKFYEEVSGLNIPILISEPEREKLIKLNKNYSDNLTLCLKITNKSNNFIGWFYGDQLDRLTFTMHSSFIAPEHRQKGFYSQTLDFVINWAQEKGFVKINSNHSTTNNPIIISKLIGKILLILLILLAGKKQLTGLLEIESNLNQKMLSMKKER